MAVVATPLSMIAPKDLDQMDAPLTHIALACASIAPL